MIFYKYTHKYLFFQVKHYNCLKKYMNTLMFILVCYGACNNLIYGSIFEGFRNTLARFGTGGYSLYKLFTCPMCLGTWMGFVISSILIITKNQTPLSINNFYLSVFLHGLLSTGGVWVTHTAQETLERAFNNE